MTTNRELDEQIRNLVNKIRVNYAYPGAIPPEEYEDAMKTGIKQLVTNECQTLHQALLSGLPESEALVKVMPMSINEATIRAYSQGWNEYRLQAIQHINKVFNKE